MNKLEQYYNKFHEENRLKTRHGTVEFTVTLDAILKTIDSLYKKTDKAVPLVPKIADIGAGTGRYSVELCHRGFDVTAVELVKHNLEILRRHRG